MVKGKNIFTKTPSRIVKDNNSLRGLTTQEQFRAIVGEPGYTPIQVYKMLYRLGITNYSELKIKGYVRKNGLEISVEDLGITHVGQFKLKYLTPKSRLQKIIEGFDIPCTLEDLERAAHELGYKT